MSVSVSELTSETNQIWYVKQFFRTTRVAWEHDKGRHKKRAPNLIELDWGFLLPIKRCLLFVRSEFAEEKVSIKFRIQLLQIQHDCASIFNWMWLLLWTNSVVFLDNFSCKLDWTILPQIETSLIKAWWERKNEREEIVSRETENFH